MWNAAQWRKYKKPARFKKTSISYPHVLLLYYFHFVLSMFCTFVFTASCKAGHCCGTQDLFGGREWWWHNRCCQSPCKQYYVFFPVRRAVLLRCPDLLLLFLFICTKTSSCTHLPLLFVQYVWSSSKKPSSSNSSRIIFLFACRSWHVPTAAKPASICPLHMPHLPLVQ